MDVGGKADESRTDLHQRLGISACILEDFRHFLLGLSSSHFLLMLGPSAVRANEFRTPKVVFGPEIVSLFWADNIISHFEGYRLFTKELSLRDKKKWHFFFSFQRSLGNNELWRRIFFSHFSCTSHQGRYAIGWWVQDLRLGPSVVPNDLSLLFFPP